MRVRLSIAVSIQIIKMDKINILYAEKFIGFFLTMYYMYICSTTYPHNVEASAHYDVIV